MPSSSPARLMDQFAGVPEANGEEFKEPGGVGLLPRLVPLFLPPLNKTGPAGQCGQFQREIILS